MFLLCMEHPLMHSCKGLTVKKRKISADTPCSTFLLVLLMDADLGGNLRESSEIAKTRCTYKSVQRLKRAYIKIGGGVS